MPRIALLHALLVLLFTAFAGSAQANNSPAFRAKSSASGASKSMAVPAPAGTVSGDCQVVVFELPTAASSETVGATPSGWTQQVLRPRTGGDGDSWQLAVYTSTSANGSVTFTKSGTGAWHAERSSYSSCSGFGPFIATGHTASTSHTTTAVTTVNDGDMVEGIVGTEGTLTGGTQSFTPPSGWTERYDANLTSAHEAITTADTIVPTAGTATTGRFISTRSDDDITAALVLQAVVPPPPPPQCSDALDNDSDTLIDFPTDPGCTSATDTDETNPTGTVLWRADGSAQPVGHETDSAYIIEREWSAYSDDSAGGTGEIFAPWTNTEMFLTSGTGDVLAGKRSYYVSAPAGETRHELKMAHPIRPGFDNRVFSSGQETWCSWAVKMVQYTHPPSGQWMVNQFRHVNETGLTSGGSPHGLAIRSGPNWQWVSDSSIYSGALDTYDMGVPVAQGQVLKLTFHAKWSADPALGFMEVFVNPGSGWLTGFPLRHQATLLFNSTTGLDGRNHMRFGIYRVNSAGTIQANPATEEMGGLNCSTSRALAEQIAFG